MTTLVNNPAFVAAIVALILSIAAFIKAQALQVTAQAAVTHSQANGVKLDAIHVLVDGNLAAMRSLQEATQYKLAAAEQRVATLEEREKAPADVKAS